MVETKYCNCKKCKCDNRAALNGNTCIPCASGWHRDGPTGPTPPRDEIAELRADFERISSRLADTSVFMWQLAGNEGLPNHLGASKDAIEDAVTDLRAALSRETAAREAAEADAKALCALLTDARTVANEAAYMRWKECGDSNDAVVTRYCDVSRAIDAALSAGRAQTGGQ